VYFLNLSLLQFLAVFGTISAICVALYLLDRSRQKLVVSTLRFWIAAKQPAVAARSIASSACPSRSGRPRSRITGGTPVLRGG